MQRFTHRFGEGGGCGVALLWLFGQGCKNDLLEVGRNVGGDLAGARGWLGDVLEEDERGVLPCEREVQGGHLVQHNPEGVDVGAAVEWLPLGLFGGHVVGCARYHADLAEVGFAQRPCQPKIGQHHLPALGEHDVGGLHIAVNHVKRVGEIERTGHGADDAQEFEGGKLARFLLVAFDFVAQGCPFDEFHDHVVDVQLGVVVEIEDLDDVGVAQLGNAGRFALKTADEPLVLGQMVVQDFDGHRSLEGGLLGAVDAGHSPTAETGFEVVFVGDGAAEEGHGGFGILDFGLGIWECGMRNAE